MGRGSGGGGGSRSSGGFSGGGRSSGGRMGGGSSFGGGSSHSSYGGSSHSSFGGGSSYGGGSRGGSYGGGGSYGRRGYYSSRSGRYYGGYGAPTRGLGGGGCGCGCLVVFLALIVIAGIMSIFTPGSTSGSSYGGNVTQSTIVREKLDSSGVNKTAYYTDELGWIDKGSVLESGMKHFFDETGIQPYLYITDTIYGTQNPTESAMEEFTNEQYDKLFTDEQHVLLVFRQTDEDWGNYDMWYVGGSRTKAVFDEEAADILMDFIDQYYEDESLSEAQFFSKAFEKAADRMMSGGTSGEISSKSGASDIILIIIFLILFVVALIIFIKRIKESRSAKNEEKKKILETPLQKFSDNPFEK